MSIYVHIQYMYIHIIMCVNFMNPQKLIKEVCGKMFVIGVK